jgi:acetolactate synthase-1/2/3 large subunit
MSKNLTVAELVVEILEQSGISQSFSVTGGAAMHLNHAFGISKKISTVYLHHEQACAMAAEGFARIKNKPAVVVVTAGPGALNSLNGVFGAYTDSIPMLIISGQVKTDTLSKKREMSGIRQLGDQEVNSMDIAKNITKAQFQILNPIDTKWIMTKAIHEATSLRPGPVWVEIPIDIQGKKIDFRKLVKKSTQKVFTLNPIKSTQIKMIIKELSKAKKPAILAGTGVRIENQIEQLIKFAEEFQIPILTAWTHDLINSDHPLFVGRPGTIGTRPGNFVLQNCDLLIVLGSRLNIRQVSYNWESFAKNAFKIWVDIDKNELLKPFPPVDVKVHSNIEDFLNLIRNSLVSIKFKYNSKRWLHWCKEIQVKYDVKNERFNLEKGRINPYELVPQIIDLVPNNSIFVCGNATACIVPFQTAFLRKSQRLFSNSGAASMGYDLPAAIGAAIASPNTQVICFAGDGSLMMNIQELQTIKHLNLNIKLIILENDGYMSIKQTQNNFFSKKFGADTNSNLTFPNFKSVSRGFGLRTQTIPSALWKMKLKSLLNSIGPEVIVARISTNQEFTPRLKSKMTSTGMVSPELDDMFPNLGVKELENVRNSSKDWKF